jgi:hypothetical protein
MAASENVQRALFLDEQAAFYRQEVEKLDSSMKELQEQAREQLQQPPERKDQRASDWIRAQDQKRAAANLSRLPQARKPQGGEGDK